MRLRRRHRFPVLALVFLLTLAASLRAQEYDDSDYDDAANYRGAALTLYLQPDGNTQVTFYSSVSVNELDGIREALGSALNCNSAAFHAPEYPIPGAKDPQDRKRIEEAYKKFSLHELSSTCPNTIRHQDLQSSIDLQLQPVADILRKNRFNAVAVSIIHHDPPNFRIGNVSALNAQRAYGNVTFQLNLDQPLGPIHLQWGYRRSEFKLPLITAAIFVVVPVTLILWMRRRALRLHTTDRAAAWFSYIHTQNLCLTAVLLVWIGGGYSTRNHFTSMLEAVWGERSVWVAVGSVLYIFLPPLIVLIVGTLASHRVFVEVRQVAWNFRNFLQYQVSQLGLLLLPALGVYSAIQLLSTFPILSIVFLVSSLLLLPLLVHVRRRLTGTYPEPVISGDFYDRILLLARRAGVKIRSIFVIPSGKLPVANAFAASNGTVMVTDYILQKLNRREVEAVAAHEIGHLQFKHPQKLGAALVCVILVPIFLRSIVPALLVLFPIGARYGSDHLLPPSADFVVSLLCLLGFYALSRHFERVADERSVTLTDDPEALITAFVKLSALNLTPLQWDGPSRALVTHPSTLKRVHRLARIGNVSDQRLEALLANPHANDATDGSVQIFSSPAGNNERVFPALKQLQRAQINVLILVLISTALPALVAYLAMEQVTESAQWALLLAGLPVTFAIYLAAMRWRIVDGRDKIRKAFVDYTTRLFPHLDLSNARLAGYSPEAWPRFYYVQSHWDTGLLVPTRDGILFIGDEERFCLPYDAIKELVFDQGISSWWKFRRSYIRWEHSGIAGVMNLLCVEPCSPWKIGRSNEQFHRSIEQAIQDHSMLAPAPPECVALGLPGVPKIKGKHPTEAYSMKAVSKVVLLAFIAGSLLSLQRLNLLPAFYVPAVVFALRFFESIPYRRYKDRPVSEVWRTERSTPVEKQGLTQSAT
ncbi:MAG TPA: M48 family metalloprotease [Terriglobales bacterium]